MTVRILVGDCRDLARDIPDASVDLVFTDPVYDREDDYQWLAETAIRVLKPGGACLVWSNGRWHRQHARWLEDAGLNYRWDFASISTTGSAPMNGMIIAKTNRMIWLDVGNQSRMRTYLPDGYLSVGGRWLIPPPPEGFTWGKSNGLTILAIACFTPKGGMVLDPFAGAGTIPCGCKFIERDCSGFEIDIDIAEAARRRVEATRVPMPGLGAEQLPLAAEVTT